MWTLEAYTESKDSKHPTFNIAEFFTRPEVYYYSIQFICRESMCSYLNKIFNYHTAFKFIQLHKFERITCCVYDSTYSIREEHIDKINFIFHYVHDVDFIPGGFKFKLGVWRGVPATISLFVLLLQEFALPLLDPTVDSINKIAKLILYTDLPRWKGIEDERILTALYAVLLEGNNFYEEFFNYYGPADYLEANLSFKYYSLSDFLLEVRDTFEVENSVIREFIKSQVEESEFGEFEDD